MLAGTQNPSACYGTLCNAAQIEHRVADGYICDLMFIYSLYRAYIMCALRHVHMCVSARACVLYEWALMEQSIRQSSLMLCQHSNRSTRYEMCACKRERARTSVSAPYRQRTTLEIIIKDDRNVSSSTTKFPSVLFLSTVNLFIY